MSARFFNPTDIRWSRWEKIVDLLPEPPLKILILAARSSQSRVEELCSHWLQGYDAGIVSRIPENPTNVTVQSVIDAVKVKNPDWMIAMGGGSVLDTAKAAAMLSKNPGELVAYLRGQLQLEWPGVPLIAVPTTAGSGSEVTPYASITDLQKMQKVSLTHVYLYPKYAVLDPSLTATLSPRQTAISGMDTLSHAIEGYWSNRSTTVTDAYALAAARLMLSALPTAYRTPEDVDARRLTMDGSVLAGLTISNATSTAVHSVSYPMTVYFQVPHGLACSILLPVMIRYNAQGMKKSKEMRFLTELGFSSMNQLAETVEDLSRQLDLPIRLRDVGITRAHITTIVANGFRPDRMKNNPRPITSAELTQLLESIL